MRIRPDTLVSRKVLFVLSALLGAGLFVWLAFRPMPAPGSSHEVVLTEDGYQPATLTVRRGDTVTFTTTRKNFFWPASNLHPSHDIYPEFDPREPVDPQGSWSFRFERPGVWKYHDHLSPYFTGIITVEDAASQAIKSTAEDCSNGKSSVPCWQEHLIASLHEKGVNSALREMARLYKEAPDFPESCHYLAHNIGIAAYKLYLKDKNSVLTPEAAFCANGFYHGFMEALLTSTGDLGKATAFCGLVKENVVPYAPDAELQCYHGIGHGAMDAAIDAHSNEGEEAIIRPALALCEEAARDHRDKLYRCASGVFNGIANFYIHGEHGLQARAEDPLWICKVQEDRFKESCYGNMNSYVFWAAKHDLGAALRTIAKIKDPAYVPKSIEYQAALVIPYLKDGREGMRACDVLGPDLREHCIKGLAHGYLEHGTPGTEYQDALKFCRSIDSTRDRGVCLDYALGGLKGWYSEAKIEEICGALSPEERSYCS